MKFDIRVRERYLRDGIVSQKDLDKHLKDLPDEAANSEESNPFEEDPVIELNSEGIEPNAVEKTLGRNSKSNPTFSF